MTSQHYVDVQCKRHRHKMFSQLLPPASEVCEGYIFTRVQRGEGGSAPLHGGIHTPLGRHPPAQCMLGYGQQAGGTNPTRMQSCFHFYGHLRQLLAVTNPRYLQNSISLSWFPLSLTDKIPRLFQSSSPPPPP